MFQHRMSSQKPGDAFIAHFRKTFPEVAVATSEAASGSPADAIAGGLHVDKYAFLSLNTKRHRGLGHEDVQYLNLDPRAQNEPCQLSPSLRDTNSFASSAFVSQALGYYTPTLGGSYTSYHNQAGNIHAPNMATGTDLGTPSSLTISDKGFLGGTTMDMDWFGHQMCPQFHYFNMFANPYQDTCCQQHQLASYGLPLFSQQDMGYETKRRDASPSDDEKQCVDSMEAKLQQESPVLSCKSTQYNMTTARPSWAEKFRFHVTLKAPTAMIEASDQIPVAYLNKGQTCSISIVDTTPLVPRPSGCRYRTLIRISFEDEQQRQRPAACWQLWNEGRGTNEAQQRGGKLQAVEYVEAKQPAESDDVRTRVDLDTASFDGFSVCWTPGMNGSPECNIAVRFNFLSTDFSHSKGVQGLPVRLCAKTETVATGPLSSSLTNDPAPLTCTAGGAVMRRCGTKSRRICENWT